MAESAEDPGQRSRPRPGRGAADACPEPDKLRRADPAAGHPVPRAPAGPGKADLTCRVGASSRRRWPGLLRQGSTSAPGFGHPMPGTEDFGRTSAGVERRSGRSPALRAGDPPPPPAGDRRREQRGSRRPGGGPGAGVRQATISRIVCRPALSSRPPSSGSASRAATSARRGCCPGWSVRPGPTS